MNENALLRLENLKKSFDENPVLKGICLDVMPGEFVTLLGPSGCGKTTTLRIIAGLLEPDAGRVFLDGKDITRLEPEKRDVNTVFQNYALFPHMNVEKNISYGLRIKGVKKSEWQKKVSEMLSLVQLEGYEKRMPSQLSGGQRQRVAIARAVVLNPRLLLLDEPLGALDLKLRRQMQQELKDIQRCLGIAFIYITHDQEEALNMSDRIAIMRDGHFEQIGTPEEIYERPKTRFAADFIGQTNLLEATVAEKDGRGLILNYAGMFIPARNADFDVQIGDSVALSLRTERIGFSKKPVGECNLPGTLRSRHYAGGSMRAVIVLDDGREITVLCQSGERAEGEIGERVFLSWNRDEAPVVR
ncbi:MAG: ABC transporter ATP-binding protein [Clostridia bacterium]|nr:ABC transporter ATP-binding protein [Clostridia bacterium]